MVEVNMETYKLRISLSEYWRIFTSYTNLWLYKPEVCSYTNLGFASVCILVNIRQYSLRFQVLLYTYNAEHTFNMKPGYGDSKRT